MPHLLPTETILEKLRRGDDIEGVTRYLYRTYEWPLRNYIRKMGGTPEDAEDIIQEVMIVFLRQVLSHQFEHRADAELGSYLIGIARRKWLKKYESETRRKERQHWFVSGGGGPQTPEDLLVEADYQSWAWELFQQLGSACREILTAYYHEDRSLEEIAVTHNLGTAGAVKMKKFRCIQKLLKLSSL